MVRMMSVKRLNLTATQRKGLPALAEEDSSRPPAPRLSLEGKAGAVKAATFRLEPDATYLAEQQHKVEAEMERITRTLLSLPGRAIDDR
jgi:hypothetical protein